MRLIARGGAGGPGHVGHRGVAAAGVVRSGRGDRSPHPLRGLLRAPRCAREADARQRHGAESGGVVERFAGRTHVRIRAASGHPLPQRRSTDGRRREVLLRALPRRFGEGVEGTGAAGPGRRPAPHTLPAQAAVARLPHLLCDARDRRDVDRPAAVRREGRRRRLQESPGGRRTIPIRLVHAWRRARAGRIRAVLAEESERQAPRAQGCARRAHAAMLKRGEADVVYAFRGTAAEDVRRTPGLTLKPVQFYGEQWLLFTDQWDPKSLWADRRVRLAINHAIDRQAINQSLTLGFSRMTGSILPRDFEFAWSVSPYPYDPQKAKQLLTEAGYPQGFEGEFWTDTGFADQTEAIASYLAAVGIRMKIRSLERAAYFTQLREKKLRPLVYVASATYGNAATRIDAFVAAGGLYTYGSYTDIEGLIQEQAAELDRKRREATLQRIQQLMHERAMFAPIWDIVSLHGYGPRVAEPALGLVGRYLWSGPYEDVRLRDR